MTIQELAQDFYQATVNKWGTEEEEVNWILKEVHDQRISAAFETEIFSLLTPEQKEDYPRNRLIPAILDNEMSGSAKTGALDFYQKGKETFSDGYLNYYLEGISSAVDFSSTGSKLALGGGIVVLGGITLASPPVAAMIGGSVVCGAALYAEGKAIKNWVDIATADSPAERRQNVRELGEGIGVMATTVPLAPKGFLGIKSGFAVLITGGSFFKIKVVPAARGNFDLFSSGTYNDMPARYGATLMAFMAKIMREGTPMTQKDAQYLAYYIDPGAPAFRRQMALQFIREVFVNGDKIADFLEKGTPFRDGIAKMPPSTVAGLAGGVRNTATYPQLIEEEAEAP